MQIGIVFPRLANGGGAYQLIHLAKELQKLGHKVTIHCYYTPDEKFSREWLKGLTVKDCGIGFPKTQRMDNQIVGLWRYISELIKMSRLLAESISKGDYDVINPHEWPAQMAAVWAKKLGTKAPIVWMCNDVWHILGEEETKETRLLFSWFNRGIMSWIERWLILSIDMILVLSQKTESIVKQFYKTTKVKVIRSGVEVETYQRLPDRERARKKLKMDGWNWLCLSVFNKHRRFEDVINAFEIVEKQTHRPMKLYIVGSNAYDEEYAGEIQRLVKTKHLEQKVILKTDYVSQEEKLAYLAAADGFISSNVQQTWGLAVVEAMASGLICIVSTGAGVHEIITNRENGLIYQEGEVTDLAQQMKWVLDKPLRVKMITDRAKLLVNQEYSWKKYASNMIQIFNEVL